MTEQKISGEVGAKMGGRALRAGHEGRIRAAGTLEGARCQRNIYGAIVADEPCLGVNPITHRAEHRAENPVNETEQPLATACAT